MSDESYILAEKVVAKYLGDKTLDSVTSEITDPDINLSLRYLWTGVTFI